MKSVRVTLTETELLYAAILGAMRRVSALHHQRPERYGPADTAKAWAIDIDGAAAEMTVAKYLGRYWEPLMPNGTIRDERPDIAPGVQVRSTALPDGRLLIHPQDSDDHVFYLVITAAPVYTIAGWIRGSDAKQKQWWQTFTGRPAYFVPQDELNACDEGQHLEELTDRQLEAIVLAGLDDDHLYGDIDAP